MDARTQAPWWAHLVCLVVAGLLFGALALASRQGHWLLTLLVALVASPGLMYLVGAVVMRRTFGDLFDPRHASWAFLADVFLAILLALAASQWRSLQGSGRLYEFMRSPWWLGVAIAVGLGVSLGWHYLIDGPNYLKVPGGEALLSDPTKLVHDKIAYFVLSAGLIWAAVPVLVYGSWSAAATWLMAGCFLMWIGGNLHDALVGLDIFRLHQPFDWTTGRPLA